MCTSLLTAIFLLFSFPAMAASNWILDAGQLQFKAQDNGKEFTGEFKKFTPVIMFDAADLEHSSITVTVDTSSVATGNANYDGTLPTPEWFNVTKFPDAVFKTNKITAVDATHFQAQGTLTMLGVSQDVILPFTLTIENNKAHATGEVTIKRLDFGLGKSFDPKGNAVSNDVVVMFDITAHQ